MTNGSTNTTSHNPEPNKIASPSIEAGIWIGIDLGTSNCTAAYWDTEHQRPRSIRFRCPDYSAVSEDSGIRARRKGGRVLPSYVAYRTVNSEGGGCDDGCDGDDGKVECEVVGVGTGAIAHIDGPSQSSSSSEGCEDRNDEKGVEVTVLSSVKRIWGMTERQIQSETDMDDTFLSSLPFHSTLHSANAHRETHSNTDDADQSDHDHDHGNDDGDAEEGARIRIGSDTSHVVTAQIRPLSVATTLLRTIRTEADLYFQRNRPNLSPLHHHHHHTDADVNTDSSQRKPLPPVRNCVIGVPAHFSRNRCRSIVQSAREAGFDGSVTTLVESTAAAVAYGLDVNVAAVAGSVQRDADDGHCQDDDGDGDDHDHDHDRGKTVLVFDMGGGTTDVTVARMTGNEGDDTDTEEATFRVLATGGDRHLGGDDMDVLLAKYLSTRLLLDGDDEERTVEWTKLRRIACNAKEQLCGDGTPDHPSQESVTVTYRQPQPQPQPQPQHQHQHQQHKENTLHDTTLSYQLQQSEFTNVIQPLLTQAETLVRSTLSSITPPLSTIDEVVLVGGATRTPDVSTMLRTPSLLPYSSSASTTTTNNNPLEFCTSIRGDKAVSQGCATHSAVLSNILPRHVLRNATMLDVLPHPIGVLLPPSSGDDQQEEMYVPVLERGTSLPAQDYAVFALDRDDQEGVTVVAVEDVGVEYGLERLGEFTFMLRRLGGGGEGEEGEGGDPVGGGGGRRTVMVGMTVETDGRFIVSIFDENDPEDRKKREAYLDWRRKMEEEGDGDGDSRGPSLVLGHGKDTVSSDVVGKGEIHTREEFFLAMGCLVLFGLYVAIKFSFHEVNEGSAAIL